MIRGTFRYCSDLWTKTIWWSADGPYPAASGLFLNGFKGHRLLRVSYAIPDLNSGIRIFKRALVMSVMKLLPNGFSFTSTITMAALYHCFLVRFVPVGYARRVGSSKIRPVKAVLGFAMLIARTMILFEPLKFFLPPSVLFGGVGLLFLVRDIIAHNLAQASILMITNGFILLAIGLLAEAIRCKD